MFAVVEHLTVKYIVREQVGRSLGLLLTAIMLLIAYLLERQGFIFFGVAALLFMKELGGLATCLGEQNIIKQGTASIIASCSSVIGALLVLTFITLLLVTISGLF